MENKMDVKTSQKTKKKYYFIKLKNLIKYKQVNFKKRTSLFPYSQVRKISKLKEKDLPRTTVRVEYINAKKYCILSDSKIENNQDDSKNTFSSEEFDIAQIATIILHTKKYMDQLVSSKEIRKIAFAFSKEMSKSDVSAYEKVFDKYASMIDSNYDKAYCYLELSLSSLKQINALMKKYIRNQKVTESKIDDANQILDLLSSGKIKNIVFDLGNVIIRYDASLYDVIKKSICSYNIDIPYSQDQFDRFCHQCADSIKIEDTPYGDLLSENELTKKIYNQFPKDDKLFNDVLSSICEKLKIGPFDFAHQLLLIANNDHHFYMDTRDKQTLINLKESGFNLYYLSNWGRWSFENMISHVPLKDYIPNGITSYSVMCNKPDKEIYLALLDKYHLDSHQCLFIDDKLENVQTAKNLDMVGYVEDPESHNIMDALNRASCELLKNHVSLELEKYFESNSYIKLNYILKHGGLNMNKELCFTEQNYLDIIQLLQEEVDECYDEIIGVDTYTTEGANIDARKAFYKMKKQYTQENKELKAALKAEDYKKARVHLKNCKKIVNDFNKSLDMMDLDTVPATILGILLKQLIWFARRLVLTLIFGLISAPIAAAASIPVAKMANSSPDYTTLFGLLKQPKVSAKNIAIGAAAYAGATVAQTVTFVQWIIATVVPFIKNIVDKQGDIDPSDFNSNLIEIKSYADTYMKHLDKMDAMISKLESAYAKDTKANKKASMKKESVDALQAYKNKLYTMCVNGEISIYEREHLLKDFEDQLYYLEASSDYDDFSPNVLPTLDDPMDSDNPQVLHPHCDMSQFDDTCVTVSPEEKFHRIKCALYHKCEDGEIDIPTRERLIALARDKYFGESDDSLDNSTDPESEQDIEDSLPYENDTNETDY